MGCRKVFSKIICIFAAPHGQQRQAQRDALPRHATVDNTRRQPLPLRHTTGRNGIALPQEKRNTETIMKKRKKIFVKDWIKLHPYTAQDSTDQYYTALANRIYDAISGSEYGDKLKKSDDILYVSLCLASWFEDIVSQTCIWNAFTAESKRRYGRHIPFYSDEATYTVGEPNLADVKFILWNYLQQKEFDSVFVAPDLDGLDEVSQKVFQIIDSEYETAPENERMFDFITKNHDGDDDFFNYRDVLKWFHFCCYVNVSNAQQFRKEVENTLARTRGNAVNPNLIIYSVETNEIATRRNALLALTTPEWMALVARQHKERKAWAEAKNYGASFFTIESEEKDYLYLKDLVTEESGLKFCKKSVQLEDFSGFIKNHTPIFLSLFWYGDSYWQNGVMSDTKSDDKLEAAIADERKTKEHADNKAVYEKFKKATGGKWYALFENNEEMSDFFTKKMAINESKDNPLPVKPKEARGIAAFATPYNGLNILYGLTPCIKTDDNPSYDKDFAEKNAFTFYIDSENIGYETSCLLFDNGMLPDACVINDNGERRNDLTDGDIKFVIDYNHYCHRERDLSPAELF